MTDDEVKSLRYAGEAQEIALEINAVSPGKRRVSFYVALLLVAKAMERECPVLARSRAAIFSPDADADAAAIAVAQRMSRN